MSDILLRKSRYAIKADGIKKLPKGYAKMEQSEGIMNEFTGPLDSNGFFRRRMCSYLTNYPANAINLKCNNESNLDKFCCFENCPVLSQKDRNIQVKIRENLIHTAPIINNPPVSFPDSYKAGRIEIYRGIRMIDWDGEKWEVYEKDGARWYIDNFSDDDFEALNDAIMTQNKIQ